jgi:haloacetate dehalogenase
LSALPDLFPGFESRTIETKGAEIFVRLGGNGPPLLLLHGYPQTHVCWHKMAGELAQDFSLVVADLRGYGQSSYPGTDPEHLTYSKRAMAQDMAEVMSALKHDRFMVLCHDRGGRVGYRLTLDHSERITRLATLDIVPTYSVWQESSLVGLGKFHWAFLAQPAPFPETMIGNAPVMWLEHLMVAWSGGGDLSPFSDDAMAHYRAAISMRERIHTGCEDYRAGASCDVAHDKSDREAGNKITCPTLALWGQGRKRGFVSGSPLDVWRDWCTDVQGGPVSCGHFLPEENPADTLEAVLPFLKGSVDSAG